MKLLDFFKVVPKTRKVRIKRSKGIIYFDPPKHRKLVFYIANTLFLGAVIYFGYLYTPLIRAIYRYKFTKAEVVVSENVPKIEEVQEIKSEEYTINIPKILAYSRVAEGVSPFDKAEYDRILKTNVVAQSKGSAAPGADLGKSTYIFAHSTNAGIGMQRNNAVFYLLGELQENDMIYIDYYGKKIEYRVFDKIVVKPDELKYLEYSDPSKNVLILQTCWPIGTDWNRLLIMAEKI